MACGSLSVMTNMLAGGTALVRAMSKVSFLAMLAAGVIGWHSPAFAYRPFDSTDPSVADPGEFEIEASPVSFRHDDSGDVWIAPA